jgi:succinoglycan biosynthesis transport protein ExoP
MTAVPQSQVSISRRALDIEDYIDIARRHISWIIGPLYAGIAISTMVAFFLPNVYVSRAMLRITPSQIPENLVPATFNQQMIDRIQQMWQEVTSRSQLSELIQRPTLDLYRKERNSKPLEDVIEDMKSKDIKIESVNFNSGNSKPSSSFVITFSYPDRFKAQQVVSALVSKLTDANQVAQRAGVNQTKDLISDEAKAAREQLDKIDKQLTDFKIANQGRLPEQLQLNVSAMTALQSRLSGINDALQRNAEQKMMGEQALSSLKTQYSTMQNAVNSGQEEPQSKETVIKNEELAQLNREIHMGEANLAVAQQNMTDKHPDIIDLKTKLDALRKRRDQMKKEDDAAMAAAAAAQPKAAPKKGVSMATQQTLAEMQARIDSMATQLTALEMDKVEKLKEQQRLNNELQNFQSRIEASPINEQKYVSLMRERSVASTHLEELQKKEQLAAQGIDINTRKAGESLDLLDPASLPETPTAPNRWQIVGIGAVLGLISGFAMAGAKEMKDTSLKNLKDVRAYTNLPVLSSIPLLENALLVRRKRRLAYVGWAIAVIVGLCGTAISLYYHYQVSAR